MVTFVGALYGPRTARMGAWALVGFVSLLIFVGWVQLPLVSVTVAAAIAAGSTLYRESIPA